MTQAAVLNILKSLDKEMDLLLVLGFFIYSNLIEWLQFIFNGGTFMSCFGALTQI